MNVDWSAEELAVLRAACVELGHELERLSVDSMRTDEKAEIVKQEKALAAVQKKLDAAQRSISGTYR